MSGKCLTSIGLVLDIIGVCVLFRFGFPQPDLEDSIKIVTTQKDPDAPWKRKVYVVMSGLGLVLLVGGFALQLWGTWKP